MSSCKECANIDNKLYKQKNVDKLKLIKRREYRKNKDTYTNRELVNNYGITLEQRNTLAQLQKFRCAICKKQEKDCIKKRLYVDHCHKTAKVRGLLCHNCNVMIANAGKGGDNPKVLKSGIEYLK